MERKHVVRIPLGRDFVLSVLGAIARYFIARISSHFILSVFVLFLRSRSSVVFYNHCNPLPKIQSIRENSGVSLVHTTSSTPTGDAK